MELLFVEILLGGFCIGVTVVGTFTISLKFILQKKKKTLPSSFIQYNITVQIHVYCVVHVHVHTDQLLFFSISQRSC